MELTGSPELEEFRSLTAAIRTEGARLRQAVLSQEEEQEESRSLGEFDDGIRAQAFSTLSHLVNYQAYGWRVLIDE